MTDVLHATSAAETVAGLEATVAAWTNREQQAQAAVAAAKRRLESVSLDGDADALALLAEIEDQGKTQRNAATVKATASAQLAQARTVLDCERTAQRRQQATLLWDRWRVHQARTDELTALMAAHEGLAYVVPLGNHGPRETTGSELLNSALAQDADITRAELNALGESVCVRSGPALNGVRTVWLSFAGPRLHLTSENWRPVEFVATADGEHLLSWESTRFEWMTMYTREVPADAVVEMRGDAAHSIDDPADRAPGGGNAP